jgi:hypothetical protein
MCQWRSAAHPPRIGCSGSRLVAASLCRRTREQSPGIIWASFPSCWASPSVGALFVMSLHEHHARASPHSYTLC